MTTPIMSGIKQWLEDHGYGPVAHEPDAVFRNETLTFVLRGRRLEIELGGAYSSTGTPDGFVYLCFQCGGGRFELADPALFDKLHAYLAS